ncbi:hypothetical protein T492DRAFT_536692 [Pavlovales sp. CCMP2436]|nr:hypothetical protein T492DRAFT_536692 [Pavlovales sp. CCMP2436]
MRNKPIVNRELSALEYKQMLLAEQRQAKALLDELDLLKQLLFSAAAPTDAEADTAATPKTAAGSLRTVVERFERERDARLAVEATSLKLQQALDDSATRVAELQAEVNLLEAESEELYERLAKAGVEREKLLGNSARARSDADCAIAERDSLQQQLQQLQQQMQLHQQLQGQQQQAADTAQLQQQQEEMQLQQQQFQEKGRIGGGRKAAEAVLKEAALATTSAVANGASLKAVELSTPSQLSASTNIIHDYCDADLVAAPAEGGNTFFRIVLLKESFIK